MLPAVRQDLDRLAQLGLWFDRMNRRYTLDPRPVLLWAMDVNRREAREAAHRLTSTVTAGRTLDLSQVT